MFKKSTKIINEVGLHARPASELVMRAKSYLSSIAISRVGEAPTYNAKSITNILILAAAKGDQIEIAAEGEDEEEAVNALVELIDSGCGEH